MDVTQISQPDMIIFGIRVMEPVTTVTDIMVATACFYAFWRLRKENLQGNTFLYLKWYFVTMGIATCIGGLIGHGFLYAFNEHWKLLGWFISMVSIMLIERSAIEHAKRLIHPTLGKVFLIINLIELLTLMTITAYTIHFRYVEFHTVYGFLVVVFSFHLFVYLKTKDIGSRYVLYTIAILSVAMFIFNYPVVVHEYFNHRDFAHVLMTISTLVFLHGALRLGKVPEKQDYQDVLKEKAG
ncbi:MAG: hypothetical protein COA57_15440 [Flavobacteriales bacterium]|nr:MAG: hypothetical protein COA57_15440 [Flavobacteriales bacterium]